MFCYCFASSTMGATWLLPPGGGSPTVSSKYRKQASTRSTKASAAPTFLFTSVVFGLSAFREREAGKQGTRKQGSRNQEAGSRKQEDGGRWKIEEGEGNRVSIVSTHGTSITTPRTYNDWRPSRLPLLRQVLPTLYFPVSSPILILFSPFSFPHSSSSLYTFFANSSGEALVQNRDTTNRP